MPNTAWSSKDRQFQPDRFMNEIYRSPRECHTQKKYVSAAMNQSLQPVSRWKSSVPRSRPKTGQPDRRVISTLLLNRSNVKRKSPARGRTR